MIPISAALRGAVELIEEVVKIEDNMLAERRVSDTDIKPYGLFPNTTTMTVLPLD